MKKQFCFFIGILIAQNAHSQLFDSPDMKTVNGAIATLNIELRLTDFNGDGFFDFFCRDLAGYNADRIFLYLESQIFNRYTVTPEDEVINDGTSSYTILPPISSKLNRDTLLFCSEDGRITAVRYIDDEEISIEHRYKLFPLKQSLESTDSSRRYDRVHSIHCGNISGDYSSFYDLLAVVGNDVETGLLIDENFSHSKFSNDETTLVPTLSYSLPGIPSFFSLASFNGDRWQDIFFEWNGSWVIWLANSGGEGFEPDNSERSLTVPIPADVTKAVALVEGSREYPIYIHVESAMESDIAYIAFPNEKYNEPVIVTIPGKNSLGESSRLFSYENTNTGERVLLYVIYNRLDIENPQTNLYTIYKIDPNNPGSPKLVQTFSPQYNRENYRYYFDRPLLVSDYDNNGVSDIVMSGMRVPDEIGEENPVSYFFMGFKGIASETRIPDWSVYE